MSDAMRDFPEDLVLGVGAGEVEGQEGGALVHAEGMVVSRRGASLSWEGGNGRAVRIMVDEPTPETIAVWAGVLERIATAEGTP